MKQLVLFVTLGAVAVAALAVGGMILIAALHDGDLAPTVISNLQTIALIVVTAVAGVVQHYMATPQPLPPSGSSVSSTTQPALTLSEPAQGS